MAARLFRWIGITKDYLKKSDHVSFFVTGGFAQPVIGGGAAYYVTSFHKSSFVFSSTIGIAGAQANAAYQRKVGERGFVTAGVSYGAYFMQYVGALPVLSYERRF
jgi:hypothetical protein